MVKNYLLGVLIIFSLSSILIISAKESKINKLEDELSVLYNNYRAVLSESDSINRVFKLTIYEFNDLRNYSDSITLGMKEALKELGIKDKRIKGLLYLLTQSSKKDSIIFRDTIFRDVGLNIDTLILDEYYKLRLLLRYPSSIITTPTFINKNYIIIHDSRKETIKPPKKYWIQRLFLKKHRVVEVGVYNNSPYTETKELRFIEIIKE